MRACRGLMRPPVDDTWAQDGSVALTGEGAGRRRRAKAPGEGAGRRRRAKAPGEGAGLKQCYAAPDDEILPVEHDALAGGDPTDRYVELDETGRVPSGAHWRPVRAHLG